MDEFIEYSRQIITYSRFWRKHKIANVSPNIIILFGCQDMIHLEVIIRNILSFISDSWTLTVIISKLQYTKTLQLCRFLDVDIQVEIHDQFFKKDYSLNLNVYYQELNNIDFWLLFKKDKFVVMTCESLFISPNIMQCLENYSTLNSYFSHQLPKDITHIGNGGIILRSIDQIKKKMEINKNNIVIPKSLDNFIKFHSLDLVPEFFFYEKEIDVQCLNLLTQNILQLSGCWVHCPWKLGPTWKNYISNILTPKYNIINDPSLLLYSESTFDKQSMSVVNFGLPLNKYPSSHWIGVIPAINFNDQIIEQMDQSILAKCSALYSYSTDLKDSQDVKKNLNFVPIYRLDNTIDLIYPKNYENSLIYSNLASNLDKYNLLGYPYDKLNKTNPHITKQNIYIFDIKVKQIPNDFDYRQSKFILIVRDLQHLENNLHYVPLFFIIPYQHFYRDKVKNIIYISKYNFFGQYRQIPCLFIGQYADKTIEEIYQTIRDKYKNSITPFYIRQSDEQTSKGIIPETVYEVAFNGSCIITNNQTVYDYFDQNVMQIADFKNKTKTHKHNTVNWIKLIQFIKNHRALEHQIQIILSVVDMILTRDNVTKINIVDVDSTNTSVSLSRSISKHHMYGLLSQQSNRILPANTIPKKNVLSMNRSITINRSLHVKPETNQISAFRYGNKFLRSAFNFPTHKSKPKLTIYHRISSSKF